tara:strand:+ start:581 stop:1633 length:1053 start_codon:yes stop_codon:yes gene_type:complete
MATYESKKYDFSGANLTNLSTSDNVVINGAMNIFQRSTSETGLGATDGYHTADRITFSFNSSGRLTSTQDSSAPSGFNNSLKLACTTADTSVAADEYLNIQTRIEGQNLQRFAKGTSDAKPFAVSFYVKGNASATYVCELFDDDNNRQISKTFNVTTDWTRVELIFPADTTGAFDDDEARSLSLGIWLHAGTTWSSGTLNSSSWASYTNANRAVGISSFYDSTDRTFFITGIQLETDTVSPFIHEDRGTTLRKCRRYYRTSPSLQGAMDNGNSNFVTMGFPGHDMRSGGATGAVIVTGNKLHRPGVTFYNLNSSGHGVYTAYCQLSPGTAFGANLPGQVTQGAMEMESEI